MLANVQDIFWGKDRRLVHPPRRLDTVKRLDPNSERINYYPHADPEQGTALAYLADENEAKFLLTGDIGQQALRNLGMFSVSLGVLKIRLFDGRTGDPLTVPVPVSCSDPLFTQKPYHTLQTKEDGSGQFVELPPEYFETGAFAGQNQYSAEPFGFFRGFNIHLAGRGFPIKADANGLYFFLREKLKGKKSKDNPTEHMVYNNELLGFITPDDAARERLLSLQSPHKKISVPALTGTPGAITLPKSMRDAALYATDSTRLAMKTALDSFEDIKFPKSDKEGPKNLRATKTKVTKAFRYLCEEIQGWVEKDLKNNIYAAALSDIFSYPDIAFGDVKVATLETNSLKEVILKLTKKFEGLYKANQPLFLAVYADALQDTRATYGEGMFDDNDVLLEMIRKINFFDGDVNVIRAQYGMPILQVGVGEKRVVMQKAIKFKQSSRELAEYIVKQSTERDQPRNARLPSVSIAMLLSCEVGDEMRTQDEIIAIKNAIVAEHGVQVLENAPNYGSWMEAGAEETRSDDAVDSFSLDQYEE